MPLLMSSAVRTQGRRKSAFTLIELLVVIAIIAILAAILFPVFAQARSKARQAAALSNAKQLGLGIMMYAQDYDDTFPRFLVTPAEMTPLNINNRLSALTFAYPYIKSLNLYQNPEQEEFGQFQNSGPSNISIWPGYAWNVDYLDYSADCSDWNNATNIKSGPPTAMGSIKQPASTVMAYGYALRLGTGAFATLTPNYPINGGYYFGTAPATLTTPEACCYSNAGWGSGSWGGPYGGFEQPRNGQGGSVVFCDGHVKFMTAGALAAGTNWTPTSANSAVTVTDRKQYLWDLE